MSKTVKSEGSLSEASVHVLVYGTLRKGEKASALLTEELGAEYEQNVVLADTMLTLPFMCSFPVILKCKGASTHCEQYLVPRGAIEALDAYEGVVQGLYIRSFLPEYQSFIYVKGPRLALPKDFKVPTSCDTGKLYSYVNGVIQVEYLTRPVVSGRSK